MKRTFTSFSITTYPFIKYQLLQWAARSRVCCFLDNHNYTSPYHSYNCLVGVGSVSVFEPGTAFFSSFTAFESETCDWLFGHINYDLINRIAEIDSDKSDNIHFPDACLFVPETVVLLNENEISIGVLQGMALDILNEILEQKILPITKYRTTFKSRIQKEEFAATINKLKEHIKYGDCYEINFCQEFYAENTFINPVDVYKQLSEVSPNPFSCFYRWNNKYVLCASPERYIQKTGNKIISQPVKGTSARDSDKQQDELNKQRLKSSEKERKENIIVVDLVRNDLSKICQAGTVRVEELCGVYSFPTVHQMISTIAGTLKPGTNFAEIIEASFPMGSMTGAPKKKVMELLEKYEKTRRGIYSGTIGYISPEKDFDFNVVIRSIVYNDETGYISYHTGAGITYGSDPYLEYEECLIKLAALVKVFSNE